MTGGESVLVHLADVESSDVGIPLLVLAELLFEKSVRKEQNGARITALLLCRFAPGSDGPRWAEFFRLRAR